MRRRPLLTELRCAATDFALANGEKVKSGDPGGFIEKEENLSHGGSAWIYGDAAVYGDARIYDNATVFGNARVFGDAVVRDNARVCDNARIHGNVWIYGDASVYDNVQVYGIPHVSIYGYAKIGGDAYIKGPCDYTVFDNPWDRGQVLTYTRSNKMWKIGFFHGTGEELVAKAYKDGEMLGKCYEAIVRAQEAIDVAVRKEEAERG